MDLFKILRPTWHTVWDTKCQRTWWTYRNHAKLSLRNVYNDINIMNDVGRKSMFFRHYTCYISNTYNGQYFLRSEFVTIFVKLLLNFVNALHPECLTLMSVYFILKLGHFIMLAPIWSNYERLRRGERMVLTRFLWNWTLSLPNTCTSSPYDSKGL